MKKITAWFLFLSILLPLLSGCFGNPTPTAPTQTQGTTASTEPAFSYPIKDSNVTLTMFLPGLSSITYYYDTANDIAVTKALEAAMGLDIHYLDQYTDSEKAWEDMFSTGDFPDMMSFNPVTYEGGPEDACKDGAAIPLNDIIEAYMPNFKAYLEANPDIARCIRADDGIYYYIPYINSVTGSHSYGAYYREDMLKEMGEEEPKTVQQWHDLLVKVKDRYGITPLACDLNGLLQYGMFAMAYGVGGNSTSWHFALNDNGEIFYQRNSDQWRSYLTEMHKWYEEGLINKDFQNRASGDSNSAITNGDAFMTIGWLSSMQNNQVKGKKINENFQLKAVATPALVEGQTPEWGYATNLISGFGTTITTSCENVELAARYLDYFFTEEGHIISNFGIEGESYDMIDGVPTFRPEIAKTPPAGYSPSQSAARYSLATTMRQAMIKHEAYYPQLMDQQCVKDAIYIWHDGVKGGGFLHQLPGTLTFPVDQQEPCAAIINSLKQISSNWSIEFICGSKTIDTDWADYIAALEDADLKTAHDIISDAMERYNAR